MNIRPEIKQVPAYNFAAKDAAIKLDQNESPYDLPPDLKAQVLARLSDTAFNRYPELAAQTLAAELADLNDWSPGGVIVTGGSNILIQALVTAAGTGRQVLTVAPTFSVYPLQARLQGAELVEVPLAPDFSLPLDALLDKLAAGGGVFFLANPAAPTANLFLEDALQVLAAASAADWLFVIDEAYHQFSGTSALNLVEQYPHAISLRTLSKAFGLGGVRLGYGVMQPELAVQLQKVIMPFSVSALQLAAGEVVLANPDFVQGRVDEALGERARVMAFLKGLPGATPFTSETNFILFRVADAGAVYEELLARGILIRRQDHLPGLSGCLRVSIGAPPENDAFMVALEQLNILKEAAHG